jgi:hypothetical protein
MGQSSRIKGYLAATRMARVSTFVATLTIKGNWLITSNGCEEKTTGARMGSPATDGFFIREA